MKLRDLDARLIAFDDETKEGNGLVWRDVDVTSLDGAQAVVIQCPVCARGRPVVAADGRRFVRGVHYLPPLAFRNPRRVPTIAEKVNGHTGWWVEGRGIDDLTFDHGSPAQPKSVGIGRNNDHAHFYITRGEITDLTGTPYPLRLTMEEAPEAQADASTVDADAAAPDPALTADTPAAEPVVEPIAEPEPEPVAMAPSNGFGPPQALQGRKIVRATASGFFGCRREPGEEFEVEADAPLGSWLELVREF